ncbi:MAG: toxic anion resistance protein [Alphaproteobacteria bacterium]
MSMPTETTESPTASPLDLRLDTNQVRQELALADPKSIGSGAETDPGVEARAQEIADSLLNWAPDDAQAQDQARLAVEDMGRAMQRDAAHRSRMLKQPIRDLAKHSEDGGPVANALVDLKVQVEDLDPQRYDFSAGWLSRMVGMIPGVGTPLKRYFTKFESSQTVIDAIMRSLETGRDQLKRDNVTLREDQHMMRELTHKLQRQIELGQALDQKLQYKLDREIPADDPRHTFLQEELLFPLRQRIMDLQQQLAVNQQGVLSTAIIIGNNKELIRGVDRALDVTVSALQVAVTVALALANQKIVLEKITAISRTTSDLIAGTAAQLRSQGTQIHAQAASASLDIESLKSAFSDINAAMDEISRFRQEALPQMAQTILEFDELTAAGEAAVQKLEKGTEARPLLQIEAD